MKADQHYKEALEAMLSYCSYQERCSSEIIQRLKSFELSSAKKEEIVEELKEINAFDEVRFVEAYISGKSRIKRWGKNKIRASLRAKQISDSMIENGFNTTISIDVYQQQLETLFTRKWNLLRNKKDLSTRGKLYRFLYGKGYENELINKLLNDAFNN